MTKNNNILDLLSDNRCRDLILETAKLLKGEFHITTHDGLKIDYKLSWLEDDYPTIGIKKVELVNPKLTVVEQWLVKFHRLGVLFEDQISDLVRDDFEYGAFSERIRKVCEKADTLKKEHGIDFHEFILRTAEILNQGEVT